MKISIILFSIFYFLFSALPAQAAELTLVLRDAHRDASADYEIVVLLDTEGQEINALEGKVVFPPEVLSVQDIHEASSLITFWVEDPQQSEPGIINFAGIIPGGFNGRKGVLFSVLFKSEGSGEGVVEMRDLKVLLNDGLGTAVPVRATLARLNPLLDIIKPAEAIERDSTPPEEFTPIISSDINVFDGEKFLVFYAQDKGSGISHYEVLENGKFVRTTNPHRLANQKLNEPIVLKAVDKSGNERLAELPAYNRKTFYEKWGTSVIIILVALGLLLARYRIQKQTYNERL